MAKLHLTIGLPQSGKSTWAVEQGYPIVNRDALRFAIAGDIRNFHYEERVTELERIMVKALFKAGHSDVIVDNTHLKQKYINAWHEFAVNPIWRQYRNEKLTGLERNFLIMEWKFHTSLEECIERAKTNFPDEYKFPSVIRSMWQHTETIDIPEFKEIIINGESG